MCIHVGFVLDWRITDAINGELALRVMMGLDEIASLQQQVTRAMAKVEKAVTPAGELKWNMFLRALAIFAIRATSIALI